jgi:hypothetical protein
VENSTLTQELERLNAQIEPLQEAVVKLESELRTIESELESFEIEQQQIDVLKDACNALDKLQELGVDELFWDGLPAGIDSAGHRNRLRKRIDGFSDQTKDIKEKRTVLQEKLEQHLRVLDYLFDEVEQAHILEENRLEEFAIVREAVPTRYQPMRMPWATDAESEGRFRRALLISLFWSLLLGILIPLVNLPIPDRINTVIEIPERMAMLLKEEPLPPPPPPPVEKVKEPEKTEPELAKTAKTEKKPKPKKGSVKKKAKQKPAGGGTQVAKKKTQNIGVLAFKSSFSDLMDEVPVAKLGTEARLKKTDNKIPGQARAQRSLVAMQATGGSGNGISNFGVSRNLGNGGSGGGSGYGNAGQIGGVGTGKVESVVAGLAEEAGRPLSDGVGAARTDEEIQIVFDRYKATLYRIYNKELRRDPTLRGKLLLRLVIEPNGEVSLCEAESTDLDSKELVSKIVARVKRFNFGPKEDVPKITILYPIDFLPAG